jgi:glycosyltransferase involved in cell wall biosynthesis
VRILLLTPQLPYPPRQGTAMRNYGLLESLSRRHQVHLVSFLAPGDSLVAAEPLRAALRSLEAIPQPHRPVPTRLLQLVTSPLPDMAHRLASPDLRAALERALQTYTFDVVQFEGIEMIPYLDLLLEHRRGQGGPLLVFDDHNAEYVLQRRVFEADIRVPRRWLGAAYSLVQWWRLRRYEAWACRQVDLVVTVSEPDREAVARVAPEIEADVVPNGIAFEDYASFRVSEGFLPRHSLVFTGKMDFRPNVDAVLWFADRVLPLVRAAVPDAQFYIVGQRPHERLERLRGKAGIVITGQVPETRPYIASADVYVIPLRSGGGTRLKVLEAMAMGRPIVSTTMGCDGFPVSSGREALLANDPPAFARQVVELLTYPERGRSLSQVAVQFAARYDWEQIVPRLERAYARCQQRGYASAS